ncbi:MAG: IS1380 family transposase [Pseudonocardiales bacterium]|nr:IS1380 family transposase [Pseudonocardiales bacterium]MBV9028746.1 IS1380 family transposase [Pseudonocardiales bacterium]MBW0010044.1 IS1380 family transposase [Pseudonocardiales bacterium]
MDVTAWSKGLSVEVGGHGVVSHVGSGLLRLAADRVGLTGALSRALARPGFWPVHDRGRVLLDPAVMTADGGATISQIDTLRHQGELFGSVASDTTVWRALEELTPARLGKVAVARARVREHVWKRIVARHGRIPPARAAGRDPGEMTVIRLDASIVPAHSDEQQAGPPFKKTFGFHPLTAWCDNTGESLVIRLRPGRAGSTTASDHIEVLTEAIAQIPVRHRRRMLITRDGAGSTHALVSHISALDTRPGFPVHYSVGFDVDERIRAVLSTLPATAWQPALDAAGDPREDAQIAELTGLLRHSVGGDRLAGRPPDMRIIIRRENPHPGAQPSLFEQHAGKRYQVIATNTPSTDIQFREAAHRTQARVEDRIRRGKNTGLAHMPSRDYAINQAWYAAVSLACDLLAWLRLLALTGDLAKAEPKTLRYRLLHTSGRIVRGQRRRRLRIPEAWPWAHDLCQAFTAILALPPP